MAISGAWLASTPIEPTVVRVETISTSSSNTWPSGVRTSALNLVRATASPYCPASSSPLSSSSAGSPRAASTTSSIVPFM